MFKFNKIRFTHFECVYAVRVDLARKIRETRSKSLKECDAN